ncbi:MCE family protein [Aeromicrobium sp. Leaf350]|uniref:MCE family protein n=1 Tax=Aeromicrobium sp. Leaf350 TaxID=2876565 RepID=UPI001E59C472|nr:MCE family protein [Aeromicrobium sp. Leaf350]
MSRFGKSFAERDRVVIAAVGLVVLGLLFFATFSSARLPLIGEGREYTAHFAEAGGLKEGTEVRVSGVKVGSVTGVELDGDVVVVSFTAKDVSLGSQTTAAVKVKTLLGQKYLAVDPGGRGDLDQAIPLERTTTPYDVTAAFSDLSENITEIDTAQLEESFTALADAFRDTPESVRTTVAGLTDLSRTISTRDEELATLLESTSQVTQTFANRNDELAALISDGNLLLTELAERRATVTALLESTASLGTQLQGLVSDNEAQLQPALAELDQVAAILTNNQANLDSALAKLGPYYRVLASASGNGRWIDAYMCGLFGPENKPQLTNDVTRDCAPVSGGGA